MTCIFLTHLCQASVLHIFDRLGDAGEIHMQCEMQTECRKNKDFPFFSLSLSIHVRPVQVILAKPMAEVSQETKKKPIGSSCETLI